jgi:hypothetical protein
VLDHKLVLALVHKLVLRRLPSKNSCVHEDEREDLLALPIHHSSLVLAHKLEQHHMLEQVLVHSKMLQHRCSHSCD